MAEQKMRGIAWSSEPASLTGGHLSRRLVQRLPAYLYRAEFPARRLLLCIRRCWGDFRLFSYGRLLTFESPENVERASHIACGFAGQIWAECYFVSLRAASFTSPTALWTSPLALSSFPSD